MSCQTLPGSLSSPGLSSRYCIVRACSIRLPAGLRTDISGTQQFGPVLLPRDVTAACLNRRADYRLLGSSSSGGRTREKTPSSGPSSWNSTARYPATSQKQETRGTGFVLRPEKLLDASTVFASEVLKDSVIFNLPRSAATPTRVRSTALELRRHSSHLRCFTPPFVQIRVV